MKAYKLCSRCGEVVKKIRPYNRKNNSILKEKELNVVAFAEKHQSNRNVATVVDLLHTMVNRITKKCFENIEKSKEGHPKALTTWKKLYAVHLAIVGELKTHLNKRSQT